MILYCVDASSKTVSLISILIMSIFSFIIGSDIKIVGPMILYIPFLHTMLIPIVLMIMEPLSYVFSGVASILAFTYIHYEAFTMKRHEYDDIYSAESVLFWCLHCVGVALDACKFSIKLFVNHVTILWVYQHNSTPSSTAMIYILASNILRSFINLIRFCYKDNENHSDPNQNDETDTLRNSLLSFWYLILFSFFLFFIM